MPEAAPAAGAEAAAAIEVEEVEEGEVEPDADADNELEEDEEEEDSDDLITHYFHITEGQSHNDNNWLTVLWSFQDAELPVHYQMEGLEHWVRMNDKAQAVNEDLQSRGKKTLPPSLMFPNLFEHLKLMGMNVLTQNELDTGCGDPDIKDHLTLCIKEWDIESKKAAKEKKAAYDKQHRKKRTAEKNDTTPGLEEAGGAAASMFHNMVMPAFPLPLGEVLAQHT